MRILIYTVPFNAPCLSVWVGPSLVSVLSNVLLLSGGAQICFPVLTNAPRLLFLSGLAQFCFCACKCTSSISVWLEGSNLVCAH